MDQQAPIAGWQALERRTVAEAPKGVAQEVKGEQRGGCRGAQIPGLTLGPIMSPEQPGGQC